VKTTGFKMRQKGKLASKWTTSGNSVHKSDDNIQEDKMLQVM